MKQNTAWLQNNVVRVARIHFVYVAALASQIILYDAWSLITPTSVMQRWLVAAALLVAVAIIWFYARNTALPSVLYRRLAMALIAADILVATFAVYTQRGMASRAVFLLVIPIITAAALRSRGAVIATTVLSVAAYTSAAISYFVLHFNEGYKIELYGEVGFYSVALFIVALLVCVVMPTKPRS